MGGIAAIALIVLLLAGWLLSAVLGAAERFLIAYANANSSGRAGLVIVAIVGGVFLVYTWQQTSQDQQQRRWCRDACDATFHDNKDSYAWRRCLDGCRR